MPVLYRASFGYLLRHPWQLALALLGICIGVAVIGSKTLINIIALSPIYMRVRVTFRAITTTE